VPLAFFAGVGSVRIIRVSVFFVCFFIGTFCFAPPIEILYRPRVSYSHALKALYGIEDPSLATSAQRLKAKEWLGEETLGHLAIKLPQGAYPGGRVFGFLPQATTHFPRQHPMAGRSESEMYFWLLFGGSAHGNGSVPGAFQLNDGWASEGVGRLMDATRTIRLEVTDAQLKKIVAEMDRLSQSKNIEYQLLPDRYGDERLFPANRFNCVTAVSHVLGSAGVKLSIFPENGSISEVVRRADPLSVPYYEGCFFRALGEP